MTAFLVFLLPAGAATAASIVAVPQCTMGGSGIPYPNTNPVLLFTKNGSDLLLDLPPVPAQLVPDPAYCAFGPNRELFVGNRGSNIGAPPIGSISRFLINADGSFAPNGSISRTPENGLQNIHGITFSPSGELFAANIWRGTISRFLLDAQGNASYNGSITIEPTPPETTSYIQGLAFSKNGELFVAEYFRQFDLYNSHIHRYKFSPNGAEIDNGEIAFGSDIHLELHGLGFSPAGELFVATATNRVYRFQFGTDGTAAPNPANPYFTVPGGGTLGVAFDWNGELLVSNGGGYLFRYDFPNGPDQAPNLREQRFFGAVPGLGGVAVGDGDAPTVPTGLRGWPNTTMVALNWYASQDNAAVKGYTVYRDGAPIGAPTGLAMAYTDRGLSEGVTYRYSVDAFDAAGNRSARCTEILVTTLRTSHVESISFATSFSGKTESLNTTVTVKDRALAPLSGVTVAGTMVYRDTKGVVKSTKNLTGTTGANGTVTLPYSYRTGSALPKGTYTFTVNSLTSPTTVYDPAQNKLSTKVFTR